MTTTLSFLALIGVAFLAAVMVNVFMRIKTKPA